MTDTPNNTPRDIATGISQSGDLSGISEMFGLRDGEPAGDTGTRTGTDTVGRWVAATEGADQPPDVSRRLVHGRYRLIAELGAGGMGVTYRAWDTKAGIPVVVKIPKREVRGDSEAMQRFAREIDAMLAVPDENIVPITDHGDDDGCPFVVMRFLPGGSLADYRRRDEAGNAIRNPPGMLHFWLPGVAAALDHIHSKGMLHRDVKPGNIFLDGFLRPYLGDFGIAKVVDESGGLAKEQTLTATKMAVGTPEYMAPELFKPRSKPDGRVDQYALAVTVYEMLSGEKPFKGDRAHIIVEHSAMPVPPLAAKMPDLPQSLCMAVEKGLAKKSEDRFSTCREFAAAVLAEVAVLPPEPDTVRLLCPSCKNILKLPQRAAGRTGKCPRCQTAMDVAADLGSLWLEEEEWERGASGHVQAMASIVQPFSETTVSQSPRLWGISEWLALLFAACCGLAAGYSWGVTVNAAKSQKEFREAEAVWREAEAVWQSERAEISRSQESLAGQRRQLETEGDQLRTAKELLAGQNRQLETERDEVRAARDSLIAQNGQLVTERDQLRTAKEALAAENRRLEGALVAARAAKPPAPLETFTNSIGIELIQIPKGEFMMGGENDIRVKLSRDFWFGKTEVTRGQWIRLMGTAPFGELMGNGASAGNTAGVLPATHVTWEEATDFCRRLTERERANGRLAANEVYRLPTEAEWEYVCRAGTTTIYSFGNDVAKLGEFGWFDGNANDREHPVGMRKANPWGLYDMHGNAREWCSDWYDGKLAGGVDPEGPAGGSHRVHRGGGWKDDPLLCRSADRRCVPSLRNDDLGFRVARSQSVR